MRSAPPSVHLIVLAGLVSEYYTLPSCAFRFLSRARSHCISIADAIAMAGMFSFSNTWSSATNSVFCHALIPVPHGDLDFDPFPRCSHQATPSYRVPARFVGTSS